MCMIMWRHPLGAPLLHPHALDWRSREAHDREYELTDAASNFPWPDDLNVMIEFELTRRQGDIDDVDNDDSDGDDFLSRAS